MPQERRTTQSPSQESESERGSSTMEVRLLLLGKRGAGKSATGNSILGKAVFESRCSEQPLTKRCQRENGVTQGREVVVIDTPDLFSSIDDIACVDNKRCNIKHCLELSAPSLHALLLVLPIGNCTVEDGQTAEHIQKVFEAKARRHTIIVFTCKDNLKDGSLEEYVKSNSPVQDLVQCFGGRYCAFNNKATKDEQDAQVKALLCKVEDLVENEGPFVVNLRDEDSRFQGSANEETSQRKDHPREPLRIILMGKSGTGKSASGNTILRKTEFHSQLKAQPVTTSCQKASREWKGRELLVVDTPGLFDTKETQDKTCKEISRCVLASCPGPHAIILVLKLGRCTEEEQKTVALVKTLFGKAAMNYMIILFTGKEDLEDQSLSNFLDSSDGNLRSLLQECGDRCCAFSNSKKTEQAEKEAQVQELVELIDKMVQNNRGAYFFDPIYKDIDQKLRQKEEDLMKSYTDTFNMQIEQRLRFILVGKSGSGKSATGNSILGRRVFESKLSARPVTQAFQQGRLAWAGRELKVVDTLDILSRWAAPRGTPQGVGEASARSLPEPHAVLLVTQLGRFTEEDQQVPRRLEEVLPRTVLVFTRNEDLDGGLLGTFLRETDNRVLAELDAVCAQRHCGFNNKGDGAELEAQLRELMGHIEGVLWEHEGRAYSLPAAPHPRAAPRESWGLWPPVSEEGRGDQAWLRGLRRILKEPEQAGGQLPPSAPI
ncbi:unnamed protein product [Rangifer tarandus platyrhynchus]|uniref:AIG1-type G domain-containing protein n=1 Tax=Rangifer tarandus platyrhynchus TaxID=3082113 RepID=A0ABN8YH19_RANTA|nr:unnamed protein product [Rangifer tarandus platyrhynchus]